MKMYEIGYDIQSTVQYILIEIPKEINKLQQS